MLSLINFLAGLFRPPSLSADEPTTTTSSSPAPPSPPRPAPPAPPHHLRLSRPPPPLHVRPRVWQTVLRVPLRLRVPPRGPSPPPHPPRRRAVVRPDTIGGLVAWDWWGRSPEDRAADSCRRTEAWVLFGYPHAGLLSAGAGPCVCPTPPGSEVGGQEGRDVEALLEGVDRMLRRLKGGL